MNKFKDSKEENVVKDSVINAEDNHATVVGEAIPMFKVLGHEPTPKDSASYRTYTIELKNGEIEQKYLHHGRMLSLINNVKDAVVDIAATAEEQAVEGWKQLVNIDWSKGTFMVNNSGSYKLLKSN